MTNNRNNNVKNCNNNNYGFNLISIVVVVFVIKRGKNPTIIIGKHNLKQKY